MIFITGDTHGVFERRFNRKNFSEQKDLSKEDYVIICGDFGGIWDLREESKREKHWLDWFEGRKYTLLFVDGNHENFDRLNCYPMKEWHGGKIHEIRSTVFHLMRGQVFEIDGKKFFTFGGAESHDISGGIFESDDINFKNKKKILDKGDKPYRINRVSWWEEELATEAEMEEGKKNLRLHNHTVDYIVTHCCASSTQKAIGGRGLCEVNRHTEYLEYIKNNVKYKKWFFGHYHDNQTVNETEIMLYDQIVRIP